MSPDPRSTESIFAAAIEIESPEDRAAFLQGACGNDERLRGEIEELVTDHFKAGGFLEKPAFCTAPADGLITERPGKQIGPYRLLEEIGEGGFGVVYMAEQEEPVRRRVALKVIKPGMDSREIIARFDAERQALVLMDHPNVARVLDAGATSHGRPFFAMDLIKGIPITEYADQASLSTPERLDLFLEVCQGVQHAHQKGIIHRDLKPTNVLVTLHGSKPVPKVIDFGVAKAIHQRLTERTLYTRYAQMIGTPLYMSPEQAALSGLDVDTRSDIYSLGVLLYELLTGTTPLERVQLGDASYDEIRRAIRETEPPTPSQRLATTEIETLRKIAACRRTEARKAAELLRGDLDWITMRALEKDRTRRYETVSAFAADVGRYLADEPVEARPPSKLYRARKFVRRNRGVLWIAACALVALTVAIGSVGWLVGERAVRLSAAARQAEIVLTDAEVAIDERDWPAARISVTRAEGLVVSRGSSREIVERVEELRRDLELVAQLETIRLHLASRLVDGYKFDHAVSVAAYDSAFRDYGLALEALPVSEAAAHIRGRTVAVELAAGLEQWAFSLRLVKGKEAAQWKRLLSIAKEADPDPLRSRARELWEAGDKEALGRIAATAPIERLPPASAVVVAEALEKTGAVEVAVDFLKGVQRHHPGDFWISFQLVRGLHELKRWDDQYHFASIAVALRPESSMAHNALGDALEHKGRLEEAIHEYREAIRIDSDNGAAHGNLGDALRQEGLLDEAVAECREAVRIFPDHAGYVLLGLALQAKGLLKEAIGEYRKAIRINDDDALAHTRLGVALAESDLLDEAVVEYEEAIRIDSDNAMLHTHLGIALGKRRLLAEAADEFRKAIRIDPHYALAHASLGVALAEKGLVDKAIAAYRAAIRLDPTDALAHYNLANALREKGLRKEAVTEYREAIRLDPDNAAAQGNLAGLLQEEGLLKEAVAAYRAAIRLDSKNVTVHGNLGVTLARLGLLDEAVNEFRQAIRIDRNNANARCNLGLALVKKNLVDEAIDEYREALRIDSKYALARFNLALALKKKGRVEEAIAECREATRLGLDHPHAHCSLGSMLRDKGLLDEAVAEFRHSIRLYPDHAQHLTNIVTLLRQERRLEELVDVLEKLLRLRPNHSRAQREIGAALTDLGRYAAAACSYREAFKRSPKLGEMPVHLYAAARAAAAAARGEGEDSSGLDESLRTRLRAEAYHWLRRCLELEGERLFDPWHGDSALAGIREEAELAKLPEEEAARLRAQIPHRPGLAPGGLVCAPGGTALSR